MKTLERYEFYFKALNKVKLHFYGDILKHNI